MKAESFGISEAKAEVDKAIGELGKRYENHIDQIAKSVFDKFVKPFCKKRKWRFVSSMGDWAFFPPNHHAVHDPQDWDEDDSELDAICDLLNTYIPGMPGNDLGSLMPSIQDYTYEEEE